MIENFIHVVDGFYPIPGLLRQRALEMDYAEPDTLTGWRTHAYQPKGIRRLIEHKFRIRIEYWEDDLTATEACNGVFFSAFSGGKRAETVGVHFDDPPSWVMLVVYLTPGAPYTTGTSFWQHRETGLTARPLPKDAALLGTSLKELRAKLSADSQQPSRWKEIDRVGNVYNRAVMFRGGLLHSATNHFGSNRHNGRLYQSFHFPIASIR